MGAHDERRDSTPPVSLGRRRALRGAAASLAAGAAALALPAVCVGLPTLQTTVAATRSGRIRGRVEDGIHVFKGIRYGADTQAHRFMPPAAPQPWAKTLDALQYAASAPQTGNDGPGSEDCLFLNVWTPGLRDGGKRPVMLYIHGGAYSRGSGSSPLYDGARLCRRGDVVVISVNHRLNAFGYLYLARLAGGELADSGNAGMLDLVLALQWVRDHALEFGADPDCVMLFGQSGGGAKIATLMAMPAAKGLFHRAATMSGQQVTASGPMHATERARAVLSYLKIPAARAADLREVQAQRLCDALGTTDPILGSGSMYFGPVLDERTLLRHPFYPDAPALSANVPMIIGNTHDETRTLIGSSDPGVFDLSWETLPNRLAAELRADIAPELVVAEYRRLYPQYSAADVFFSATTAGRSWRAAIVEAELRAAQGAPAFVYELDWKTPRDGGKWGAPHTLDIPLVFDTVRAPGSLSGADAAAQQMADAMSEAFIAFARTGNPNSRAATGWQPYDLPRRQTMVFDIPSRMADDPRGAERRLFAAVPFIQQGT